MRPMFVSVVSVLLVALFVAWWFSEYERDDVEVYTGYQGEARWNPYLAAEKLLTSLGIEAETREALQPTEWLPPPTDTLVVRADPTIAVGGELDALYDWVQVSGGHLVLLPPREESADVDLLMSLFGLGFERADPVHDDDSVDDDPETEAGGDGDEATVDEGDTEEDIDYTVALYATYYRVRNDFDSPAMTTVADDIGNIAVRVAEGNGFVTVIASELYFTNDYLADADHARLLLDAVAGYVDPGKVWLVFQASFPPLWRVIWQAAPYLVMTLAVALLLWLWAALPRFGPKIEPEAEDRRSINEHISAAGSFAWRHEGSEALAESVVQAVLHDAERRHPGIGRLAPEKQAESLAHLTGLDAQTILDGLLAAGDNRPRDFTENIQLLQTIRKAL